SQTGASKVAAKLDPEAKGGDACPTLPVGATSATELVKTVERPDGITLVGSPTVIAQTKVTEVKPENATLLARLWDVDPQAGTRTLVTRAVFRPRSQDALSANGQSVFQLHPNAYHFKQGHQV